MIFSNILLQISTAQSELGISTPVVSDSTDMSVFELIMKGGIIMIPLFILSVITVYVFVERYMTLKNAAKNADGILNSIIPSIKSGDLNSAKAILKKQDKNSVASILHKGVSKIGNPIKNIENAMEAYGKIEVMKLERNMGYLSIIAAVAPMLGFIGTITGVIKIFYNISLADNISIGLIAGGLYEKMVTSATGLVVGIIAHFAYHYLNILLENIILKMEATSLSFLEIISEE
jgi:biopolymer transport protein ExbB